MKRIARPGLRQIGWALAIGLGGGVDAGRAEAAPINLFGGFAPGWRENWREQGFPFTRATTYAVVAEGPAGGPVLRAEARDANRALLRPLAVEAPETIRLSWRWKVEAPLSGVISERSKRGDDYAARVMVVFERGLWPTRTVAINYVWAAREPAGGSFASPYSSRVRMMVLRSGADEAGQWQAETRDVWQDYVAAFGREPGAFSGVAVMVDTDNTDAAAVAWFESLVLEISPAPADSEFSRP